MERGSTAGLLGLGTALGLALVASAWIVSQTALAVKREGQTVEVKGFAERSIESDFALWRGTFTTRDPDLREASRRLAEQRAAVVAWLGEQGVPASEQELQPVQTQVLFGRDARGTPTNEVEGYALSQQVVLRSGDVDRIARVAEQSSALIGRGIELSSWAPEFFYTGLGALKIEMLGEATADARRRAGELAERSGSAIGPLRWARQGVFQITPAQSTEVSDYGHNDTSSREKSIKAVVTVRYALD